MSQASYREAISYFCAPSLLPISIYLLNFSDFSIIFSEDWRHRDKSMLFYPWSVSQREYEVFLTLPLAHIWLFFQDTGASGTSAQQNDNQLGEVENLEDFVYSPAPRGITVKCRITRDKKGMDRGLFPTYYMHLEKDENRKVWELILFILNLYLLIWERDTSICCSTFLCVNWLILVCVLTKDQTYNLSLSGQCSNQLTYLVRTWELIFKTNLEREGKNVGIDCRWVLW